jgi:hypothetical protein
MSAKTRLAIDIVAFCALLAAYNPAATGLPVHEWISIAVIVPLLVHTVLNWEWTVRIAETFFDRLIHQSRLNLVVDSVLFVSSVTVMLSGLMISQVVAPSLGFAATPTAVWVALHAVSADATVALLLAHFALHWKWMARVLGATPVPSR